MNSKHIHCIGIGGIGLSALAQFYMHPGVKISGCDLECTPWTKTLEKKKIKIYYQHDKSHINKNLNAVIRSIAISEIHPEIMYAKKIGVPVLTYPEALGELIKNYFTVAVCGSHGKTTVTALLAKILLDNNYDPNAIVGTTLKEFGNQNFRKGNSCIFIIEACEYEKAFLEYFPKIIICTNIDHDHFDTYKTLNSYKNAYLSFIKKMPGDGYLFINGDDKNSKQIIKILKKNKFPAYNIFTFGLSKKNSFYLKNNKIVFSNKREGKLLLKIPGMHNKYNALAAYAAAKILNIESKSILKSLHNYQGSGRRLEYIGKIKNVKLISDYGHHPTEIKATLQALREIYPKQKILLVYQPHQYSRTRTLLSEFAKSFNKADFVIIPNIYAARDSVKERNKISTENLVQKIKKYNKNTINGRGFENTAQYLKEHYKKFSIIVFMGAGDVWKIIELFKASVSK